MKCSRCDFENREGAKFCGNCKAKLSLICAQCNTENPPINKYCDECGNDLQTLKEKPSIDYSQPQSYTPKHLADKILTTRSSIEGERKLVTVFFADVANYTSMSEKLDPEEVHQIMDGCFQILIDEIHKHEGTINQFTGDGVMALFGAPVAHEDHAQRACYAALSVQKVVMEYSDKIKKDTGVDFKMRIGLNSGLVIVGSIGDDLRMDYTAVGDTTNLASRMESEAEPGTILVSEITYKITRSYFEFDHIGKIEIKGKEKPQEAYRLLRTGEVKSRLEASIAKGLTKFVGRRNSMAALKEPFEKVQSGSGQVVGVVGEAGVGKSRLLFEFINQIPSSGFIYIEGRCLHFGGSMGYLPIIDILKSYFDINETDREYIINKKINEKILGLDDDLKHTLPCFQEILSLKVEDDNYLKHNSQMKKLLTFEAIRDLLIRASQDLPLVIAVDDLQWIDKTSEELLDYLIGWLANARILLILLYRPEYTHQWGSKTYYSKIGLDQLGAASSQELITAMLEDGEVVPELRELILNRAAGNPLFMEEFAHTLQENGSIKRKENKYVLSGDISGIQVPDTIQGIIAARMDRLENNLKRTMQVASVIGKDFAFRILQAITGMKEELKSYLLNLQGLEFIYEKQLFPELEYIFKHALIREVAYDSLLLKRRKEIHENIGIAIEDIYEEKLEDFYEMLAYHYSRSDNLAKAIEYLKLSSEKALAIYAYAETVQILEQALKLQDVLDPDDHVNKLDLLKSLGNALIFAGEPKRVIDEIAPSAFTLAESIGESRQAVEIIKLAISALTYYGWGDAFSTPEAAEWAERAKSYEAMDISTRAYAYMSMGMVKNLTARRKEAIPLLNQALELARQSDDEETVWTIASFWLSAIQSSRYANERKELYEELISRSRVGLSFALIRGGLWHLSSNSFSYGYRERAEAFWDEFIEFAERTKQANAKIMSSSIRATRAYINGHLEDAVKFGLGVLSLGDELGLRQFAEHIGRYAVLRPLICLGKTSSFLKTIIDDISDSDPYPYGALSMAYFGRKRKQQNYWKHYCGIVPRHLVKNMTLGIGKMSF
jgi:class 3 adenylate cyclase